MAMVSTRVQVKFNGKGSGNTANKKAMVYTQNLL